MEAFLILLYEVICSDPAEYCLWGEWLVADWKGKLNVEAWIHGKLVSRIGLGIYLKSTAYCTATQR